MQTKNPLIVIVMKKNIIIGIIAVSSLLTSCSVTRYISADLQAAQPDSIPVLEPYTSVFQLNVLNEEEFSDSLTNVAHNQLLDILETPGALPTGSVLYMQDADFYQEIGADVARLFDICYGNRKKNIEQQPLPESLREFMHDNNLPYVAFLFQDGFTHTGGDYALQVGMSVLEAVLTTVLTMGMVTTYTIPYKDALTYRLLIADLEANRVAYFNRVSGERSPVSHSANYYMLERAFSRYPHR